MTYVSTIGIDPGRVHTGCVALEFHIPAQTIDVTCLVINSVDVRQVRDFVEGWPDASLFIEDYNPSNYAREDKLMSEALGRLKAEFPPSDNPIVKYVDNAGVNTIIPTEVQKLFGVHRFPVSTHHNDLNSAGKIALLGMVQDKNGVLRNLVSTVIKDSLIGFPWKVVQHA